MSDVLTPNEKDYIDTELRKANKYTDLETVSLFVYEIASKIKAKAMKGEGHDNRRLD